MHMLDNLSVAVHVFFICTLTSLTIYIQRYVNWSTNFRGLPLNVPMGPVCLKLVNSVCLFGFYDVSTFVGYLMPNPFLYK